MLTSIAASYRQLIAMIFDLRCPRVGISLVHVLFNNSTELTDMGCFTTTSLPGSFIDRTFDQVVVSLANREEVHDGERTYPALWSGQPEFVRVVRIIGRVIAPTFLSYERNLRSTPRPLG